jgi:hypothetical protein
MFLTGKCVRTCLLNKCLLTKCQLIKCQLTVSWPTVSWPSVFCLLSKFLLAKYLLVKYLLTKWLLAKCLMTKSQLAKCLSTKRKFEEKLVNQSVCRPNVFRPKDKELELCLKRGKSSFVNPCQNLHCSWQNCWNRNLVCRRHSWPIDASSSAANSVTLILDWNKMFHCWIKLNEFEIGNLINHFFGAPFFWL